MALEKRARTIYDNLIGLATSGVLTEMPSADELTEGLAHLGLHLNSDKELFSCLDIIRGSLRGQPQGFREFFRALQSAQQTVLESDKSSDSDDSESEDSQMHRQKTLPLRTNSMKTEHFDEWDMRSSHDDDDDDSSAKPSPSPASSVFQTGLESPLEAGHRDVLRLLEKAGSKLALLSQESLSSHSHKLCSRIQELVNDALEHAKAMEKSLSTATQALENSLSGATEGIRKSQQLMSQGKEAANSLIERAKKAEEEVIYWRGQARLDLEDVLAAALPKLAKISPAATFNRLMRLAGAEAIAFAWFRASALLLPMRRRSQALLDQLAVAQCSERLRRRSGLKYDQG
eukprot:TRINITY_DN97066_c0_g1_i1.p1 TRINITY_DN97066_c0_g1~~TRINITY_DN97066_c0_g1_i1.p1  ORF type:complete len:345 (-),score=66.39 TRINITY_DN97066_c0_g1_i1:82-1116(-)